MNVEEPAHALTFGDNHETARNPSNAIINDKMLAYAFILTHEGYPCVFWLDHFNYGLARVGTANGIAALVDVQERYAAGRPVHQAKIWFPRPTWSALQFSILAAIDGPGRPFRPSGPLHSLHLSRGTDTTGALTSKMDRWLRKG
jgi:hypothetical protein